MAKGKCKAKKMLKYNSKKRGDPKGSSNPVKVGHHRKYKRGM